ncbi:MAG: signal peptidase I [Nanobdellota archaeon]
MSKKYKLKKLWKFIWDDDSLLSWLINIALAFLLIKFIVYPGIGFFLGTTHPIVAVVSGSMEHKTVHPCEEYNPIFNECTKKDESVYWICDELYKEDKDVDFDFYWKACGNWYKNHDITKEDFSEYSFKNGFNTGDIIVLKGTEPKYLDKGDVIVFYASKNYPIIHRIVDKRYESDKLFFTTKGDHNEKPGTDDTKISEENIIGEAVFRIPYVGWIKIVAHKAFIYSLSGLNKIF